MTPLSLEFCLISIVIYDLEPFILECAKVAIKLYIIKQLALEAVLHWDQVVIKEIALNSTCVVVAIRLRSGCDQRNCFQQHLCSGCDQVAISNVVNAKSLAINKRPIAYLNALRGEVAISKALNAKSLAMKQVIDCLFERFKRGGCDRVTIYGVAIRLRSPAGANQPRAPE